MSLMIRVTPTDVNIEIDGVIKGDERHSKGEQIDFERNKGKDGLAGSYREQSFKHFKKNVR